MYVITVDFQLHPEHQAAFMPLMLANAKASVELEPECVQFDVCVSTIDPCHVFLYEIYHTEAAFKAHLQMPHFLQFNSATATFVASKSVRSFDHAQS